MSTIRIGSKPRLQFPMEYIKQAELPVSVVPIYKKQKSIMGDNQQDVQVHGQAPRPKEFARQLTTQCSIVSNGNFSVIDIDSPTVEYQPDLIIAQQPAAKEKISTFMKMSMYTVMLLCLLVLALMFGVFLWKMTAVDDPYSVYCTPCEQLKLNSDPLYDYRRFFEKHEGADGVDMCCPNSPETQKKMFEVMMKQTAMKEQAMEGHTAPLVFNNKTWYPPKPEFNHDAVYAHIETDSSSQYDLYRNQPGMAFIRKFELQDRMAFKRKGIGFDKLSGRFIITKQGTYLVQCQIAYISADHQEDYSGELAHRRFKFAIMRSNRGYPLAGDEEIVSHEEQVDCRVNAGGVCHTGIAAATPMLQEKDEVFLVSRFPELIKTSNFASSCSIVNLD